MRKEIKIWVNWCGGLLFAVLSFYLGHYPETIDKSVYNAAGQFLGIILAGLLTLNVESRYLKLFWAIIATMINFELVQDVFSENYKPTREDLVSPFIALIIFTYVISTWKASKNKS